MNLEIHEKSVFIFFYKNKNSAFHLLEKMCFLGKKTFSSKAFVKISTTKTLFVFYQESNLSWKLLIQISNQKKNKHRQTSKNHKNPKFVEIEICKKARLHQISQINPPKKAGYPSSYCNV